MHALRLFFQLLTPRERRQLYGLFAAVVVMALLEVVSVASIMPFLSVAADPARIHTTPYLQWAYESLGFADTNAFLIALGFAALGAMLVSNIVIVATTWAIYHYAWMWNHNLSRRLLQRYMERPYAYFLTRNSAELGKNVLEEIREVVNGMLVPALKGGAKAVVALFIAGFVVAYDPWVALIAACVLGSAYVVMYMGIRHRIRRYGEERVQANSARYQHVAEAFGSIKESKLHSPQAAERLRRYTKPSAQYARYQARYSALQHMPRYALEVVAFGGIILIAVYLIAVQDTLSSVIPTLGVYAFAGYRLLPALQGAFKGAASVQFNTAALRDLREGLQGEAKASASPTSAPAPKPLPLHEAVTFDAVTFRYPGAQRPALQNVSIRMDTGQTVGIVGATGSGKTTAVDLMLGLLEPQQGTIRVDGEPLRGTVLQQWQQAIGYVPQHIYLEDTTIAQNIAFGVPPESIDMEAVQEAARMACIADFVEQELPEQWQTPVGERGVALSGGQRQRIGLARALYRQPSVLVLDEATSALDRATEAQVMQVLHKRDAHRLIVCIAHRIHTLKQADHIIQIEAGRVVAQGSYDALHAGTGAFASASS
jgi:ATP-binding cassette subfamily C protein